MPHARYRAGMDAFPVLLLDESEEQDEDAMTALLRDIVQTQACVARSVALVKSAHAHLDDAHQHLHETQHTRCHDA